MVRLLSSAPGSQALDSINNSHQFSPGPIIRINPKVVHISDLSFLSTIYANRGRNQAGIGGSLLVQHSVGATEDWDLHKQRRDALNPYFSQKSVLTLEPLLKRKTQELREWFDDAIRLQKPINLSDAFYAFSNEYFVSMLKTCIAERSDG